MKKEEREQRNQKIMDMYLYKSQKEISEIFGISQT